MSTGRYSFKGTDAARLIRATRAAGLAVKRVTLENGVVTLQVDESEQLTDTDRELAEFEARREA
jgi:hypothetical protein